MDVDTAPDYCVNPGTVAAGVGQLKKQVPVDLVILPHEGHMPHHGEGAAVADAIRRLASDGISG